MIEYNKVQKGDTLKVVGAPHYNSRGSIAVEKGSLVQVVEVFPAGVRVKSEDGTETEFYFDHGAEKLDYTKETRDAIKQRSEFGKIPGGAATGDKKPDGE
jgi:hypothetical protein